MSINIEYIAEMLEFDVEDVEMLIDMFLSDAKESLSNIEATIKSDNFEQMKNIAHGIKGSALNLMFEDIASLSLEIEELAKTESCADYQTLFEKLENELKSIEDIKVTT